MPMYMRFILAFLLLAASALAPAAGAPVTPFYRVTTFIMPQDSFPTVADMNNAGQLVGQYIIQGNSALATGYISAGRELRPLPPMPGYSTWANGANDTGAVVGVAADASDMRKPDRAFFYSGGQLRDLGTLGGAWARPTAVNDAGQVIGMSANASGETRAFLYLDGRTADLSALVPRGIPINPLDINKHGHMLGVLLRSGGPWVDDGVRSAFLTIGPAYVDIGLVMASFNPAGVNDLDQVAGTAVVGVPHRTRAYLFQNGGVSNLGTLGGNNSGASAINNAGQVVGFSSIASGAEHAFLYQNGVMQDIATLGVRSRARDINERGQVAGHYTDAAGHTRAFIYDNGAMRDIGTLGGDYALATDIGNGGHVLGIARNAEGIEHNFVYADGMMAALPAGAQAIRALGINGIGDVVGSLLDGPERGAFLWSGGTLYDIAAMVSPQWRVYDAVAINDRGQIAATGCRRGACSAVLLSPIPEPAVTAMLLAGLAATGLLRRRRPRLQEDRCQKALLAALPG